MIYLHVPFQFGTVKGNLHGIGKNLVIMMLEGAGFQVTDLGVDVAREKFIEASKGGAYCVFNVADCDYNNTASFDHSRRFGCCSRSIE